MAKNREDAVAFMKTLPEKKGLTVRLLRFAESFFKEEEGTQIAKWVSKSGKDWVTLSKSYTEPIRNALATDAEEAERFRNFQSLGYSYKSPSASGTLSAANDDEAIQQMQAKVDSGYFLPDVAKTPMRRVESSGLVPGQPWANNGCECHLGHGDSENCPEEGTVYLTGEELKAGHGRLLCKTCAEFCYNVPRDVIRAGLPQSGYWVGESKLKEDARLSIRPNTYRDKEGFLVCGTDNEGRSVKIFANTREGAEKIVAAIKQGTGDGVDGVDAILLRGESKLREDGLPCLSCGHAAFFHREFTVAGPKLGKCCYQNPNGASFGCHCPQWGGMA